MAVNSPRELFDHELQDIFYAEHKLVEALTQLASESTRPDLRQAFETHRQETQQHVQRLTQVFQALGQEPQGQVCYGIDGLIKEKQEFGKENPSPQILDVFNIGAGQKSERYEITAYEGLIQLAQQAGLSQVTQLLQANLQDEVNALHKLQTLAKSGQPVSSAAAPQHAVV